MVAHLTANQAAPNGVRFDSGALRFFLESKSNMEFGFAWKANGCIKALWVGSTALRYIEKDDETEQDQTVREELP